MVPLSDQKKYSNLPCALSHLKQKKNLAQRIQSWWFQKADLSQKGSDNVSDYQFHRRADIHLPCEKITMAEILNTAQYDTRNRPNFVGLFLIFCNLKLYCDAVYIIFEPHIYVSCFMLSVRLCFLLKTAKSDIISDMKIYLSQSKNTGMLLLLFQTN